MDAETILVTQPPDWFSKVLEFLTVQELMQYISSSKELNRLQTVWESFWKVVMKVLHYQYDLHHPQHLPMRCTWKQVVMDLWNTLTLWTNDSSRFTKEQPNRIKVYVRFKPNDPRRIAINKAMSAGSVVLPLHQKIQLVKAKHKELKSTSQAIQYLKKNGEVFGESKQASIDFKIHAINEKDGEVLMVVPSTGLRNFKYDGVMDIRTRQEMVFNSVCETTAVDFMNGLNGSILVYGQTGSGKTHTMFGPDCPTGTDDIFNMGCVPRMCKYILSKYRKRKNVEAALSMSYVEVYGQQVFDLLKDGQLVEANQVAAHGRILGGKNSTAIENESQLLELLDQGEQAKRKARTEMNERSTRAHAIIVLSLKQRLIDSDVEITSNLFMADLGGSEKIKKSGVSGEQQTQAIYINLGLLALKNVISALQKRQKFVPYNDSRLTQILAPGIAKNCRTSIIVCSDETSSFETLQSLRFGEQCASVKVTNKQKAQQSLEKLQKIDEEIDQLNQLIQQKERWENGVPIAAEEEHQKLELLYLQRAELTA